MSLVIPSIAVPVPVTSPNLIIYPPVDIVLLKGSGFGESGYGTITTTGSAQEIASIPISALGIDLLKSDKALLTFETAQDIDGLVPPTGYAFAICPDSNISNVSSVSRDYITGIDPCYFPTTTSLVLTRANDYPAGVSNISIFLTAASAPGYNLTTSNALNYSISLISIA